MTLCNPFRFMYSGTENHFGDKYKARFWGINHRQLFIGVWLSAKEPEAATGKGE